MNAELEARLSLMIDAGQRGDKAMVRALAEPDEEDGPPEDRDGAPVNEDALARVLALREAFIAAKRLARGKAVGLAECKHGSNKGKPGPCPDGAGESGGKGKKEKATASVATPERYRKAADKLHREGVKMLAKLQRGEYHPEDVAHDAEITRDELLVKTRSIFAALHNQLKGEVAQYYGAKALESKEWAAVKDAFKDALSGVVLAADDYTDALKANAAHFAKHGAYAKCSVSEMDEYRHRLVQKQNDSLASIWKAADALVAKLGRPTGEAAGHFATSLLHSRAK